MTFGAYLQRKTDNVVRAMLAIMPTFGKRQ
jgi:hypothetical protein